jgi:hypothetical protein
VAWGARRIEVRCRPGPFQAQGKQARPLQTFEARVGPQTRRYRAFGARVELETQQGDGAGLVAGLGVVPGLVPALRARQARGGGSRSLG